MSRSSNAALTHLLSNCTAGGSWPAPGRCRRANPTRATQARKAVRSSLPSGTSPKNGRTCVRKNLSVTSPSGRPEMRHRRPPLVPPLADGDPAEPRIDQRPLHPVDLDDAHVRLGVLLALELLRSLLAVGRAEPHEVRLRSVAQPLLDDRRHRPTLRLPGAHQVHRQDEARRTGVDSGGQNGPAQRHFCRPDQVIESGLFPFTPWRSWDRGPYRPPRKAKSERVNPFSTGHLGTTGCTGLVDSRPHETVADDTSRPAPRWLRCCTPRACYGASDVGGSARRAGS